MQRAINISIGSTVTWEGYANDQYTHRVVRIIDRETKATLPNIAFADRSKVSLELSDSLYILGALVKGVTR